MSIYQRPLVVAHQSRFGDMETDLIKCKNGYLITLTERKSLFNFIAKNPNKEAATIEQTVINMIQLFKQHIHTITSDNGTEFAHHENISQTTGVKWFFADLYQPQQRGCNENQNSLIRQFLKRDTHLQKLSDNQIQLIQNKLNSRPRKKNQFISPSILLRLHHVAFDG